MTTIMCPLCRSPAGDGKQLGDSTVFRCPKCGDYRMSGTLLQEIENRVKKLPTPEAFKELVKKKKGKATEWPVITSYDIP